MKEFTPDKYLGHKINRISRSIDKYFDRKRCSKTECIPRSQGMMIGYIMDNQDQNISKGYRSKVSSVRSHSDKYA